jgi:hypothetical protein
MDKMSKIQEYIRIEEKIRRQEEKVAHYEYYKNFKPEKGEEWKKKLKKSYLKRDEKGEELSTKEWEKINKHFKSDMQNGEY